MRNHCEKCSGSGRSWLFWTCSHCKGRGAEPPPKTEASQLRDWIRESERISCFSGCSGLNRIRLLMAIDRARIRLRQIERAPVPPPPPPRTHVSSPLLIYSALEE